MEKYQCLQIIVLSFIDVKKGCGNLSIHLSKDRVCQPVHPVKAVLFMPIGTQLHGCRCLSLNANSVQFHLTRNSPLPNCSSLGA